MAGKLRDPSRGFNGGDDSLCEKVLALAELGFAMFPARGKRPAIPGPKHGGPGRGCYDGTRDPDQLRAWFSGRWAGCNVAVTTGAASGFWILDIDGEAGVATLRGLQDEHGSLPATVTARGRDGVHLHAYFQHDPARPIGNRVRFADGLDTRADGGYAICPPSINPVTGVRHRWLRDPWQWPIAVAPSWLVDVAAPVRAERKADVRHTRMPLSAGGEGRARGYALAVLRNEAERVAGCLSCRNNRLNVAAFNCARLAMLTDTEIAEALEQAAKECGLWADDGKDRTCASIASGIKGGRANPVQAPGSVAA